MTLFELYLSDFEEAKKDRYFAENDRRLSERYGHGSFEWFKAMAGQYFGGGYLYHYKNAGITIQQLREAKESGLIKYQYYSNWTARHTNWTEWYGLTVKGLKELYKEYKKGAA